MKLCMGCMEYIDNNITTCPSCGYDGATLRQESYYLAPGTVVGERYIVGRAMSYEGDTVVYLGMDAERKRKVIIKEYLPVDFSTRWQGEKEITIYSGDALGQFEQGLTVFLNEANRIRQLHDVPGIVRIYDCVAENDTGYVISEYLEGSTLKEMLDSGKRFTPEEAKDFAVQILPGLHMVHSMGIIHCDIAPETIMITSKSGIGLMDFGAARYVTAVDSRSLAILLKHGYAPEEQYRSRGERGPWTDVYALAAVMYRMITGRVPDGSVDRALVDELKAPSGLGIHISESMENAMMNALNVYQRDRTPSAQVFLDELNSGYVKRIRAKKQRYETGKFPGWAKGFVAGLLCLAAAGGGIVGYQLMNSGAEQGKNTSVLAPDIVDATEEAAKKSLGEIQLDESRIYFNAEVEGGSRILSQEPAAGNRVEDNRVSCEILTSTKCNYADILENADNVISLADYLNLDESVCTPAAGDDRADERRQFYNLYAVVLQDGSVLSLEDLKKNAVVEIRDIKNIQYYVSPFFYEKSLKDYTGEYIDGIKFKKYTMEGKMRKELGETATPSVSRRYFSLSSRYKEGYVVKQNIKAGREYDSSKTDTTLFDVVRAEISWTADQDAETIAKKIRKLEPNVRVNIVGSGSMIASVKAAGRDVEGRGALFTSGAAITITKKEPPATPAPKPTPAPQRQATPRPADNTPRKPDRPGDVIE